MADVTTVIGDTMRLQGNLQGDEDLQVFGRVEGTIELTQTLIVEPSGIVKADVEVQNAVISGVVVGNVTAADSVEITREGRMVGDIAAPRVILVDGASFKGQVDMGDLALPRPERNSAPASRPQRSSMPSRAIEAEVEVEAEAEPEPEEVEAPRRPEPSRRAPSRPAPAPAKAKPTPVARGRASKTGKKATTEAPKPQMMRSKKRRVSVKKR